MSGKKKEKKTKSNVVFINKDEYVGKNQIIAFLLEKIKSFSGYGFISIGIPGSVYKNEERKNIVLITVHKNIPILTPEGLYKSDKDIVLEAMEVGSSDFKGVVIDRHGHGIIGNPFAPVVSDDLTTLGNESGIPYEPTTEQTPETPFGIDESVETL
jgi:hypothetical protein